MKTSLGLTVLSAILYGASFPPLSLAPLIWVALVPLLVAAVRVSPARAACCGLVWGVVAAYAVGWWFPGMMSSYFERPVWLGWVAFVTVSIALAGTYYATFAAWVSWLARRGGASPLMIAAGWGACELARARLWVGNPWALSGYSQVHFAPVLQLADLAGPYGIGVLIAAVNAVVACALARSQPPRRLFASAVVVAAALGASVSYGRWRLGQDFAEGDPIRVAIVQGAVERRFGWQPEYRRLGLDRYLALTTQAATSRPDLVVWPEYAVSFYLQERSPERDALAEGLRASAADVVLGGPSYRLTPEGTQYFNSAFLVHDGGVSGRYDKSQLLPWAEQRALGQLVEPRGVSYTPGGGHEPLRARIAAVGVFLCSESMYPEVVGSTVVAGADLLANLTNDAWLGRVAPARHHLEMASFRAVESRRYLLRAASTGFSAIIDPHGRVREVSGFGEPAVLTSVVYRSTAVSPYQKWGDLLPWAMVGGVVWGTIVRNRFGRPPSRATRVT